MSLVSIIRREGGSRLTRAGGGSDRAAIMRETWYPNKKIRER